MTNCPERLEGCAAEYSIGDIRGTLPSAGVCLSASREVVNVWELHSPSNRHAFIIAEGLTRITKSTEKEFWLANSDGGFLHLCVAESNGQFVRLVEECTKTIEGPAKGETDVREEKEEKQRPEGLSQALQGYVKKGGSPRKNYAARQTAAARQKSPAKPKGPLDIQPVDGSPSEALLAARQRPAPPPVLTAPKPKPAARPTAFDAPTVRPPASATEAPSGTKRLKPSGTNDGEDPTSVTTFSKKQKKQDEVFFAPLSPPAKTYSKRPDPSLLDEICQASFYGDGNRGTISKSISAPAAAAAATSTSATKTPSTPFKPPGKTTTVATNSTGPSKYWSSQPQPHRFEQSKLTQFTWWYSPQQKSDGIRNLGNTCYLSAVLQALLHEPNFVRDLSLKELTERLPGAADSQQSGAGSSAGTKDELPLLPAVGTSTAAAVTTTTTAAATDAASEAPVAAPQQPKKIGLGFYRAISEMAINSQKDHGVLNPTKLKESLGRHMPQFNGYNQQDAHEFLTCSLSLLSDELAPYTAAPKRDGDGDVAMADQPQQVPLCPVARNFVSEVTHTLRCSGCQLESKVVEQFTCFSLDIKRPEGFPASKPLRIINLLRLFFESDEVEKRCDQCGCQRATQEHKISALPRVLILHIKRFVQDSTGRYTKSLTPVIADMELDLSACTTPEFRGPVPFTGMSKEESAPVTAAKKPDEEEDDVLADPFKEKTVSQQEEEQMRQAIEASKSDFGPKSEEDDPAIQQALLRSLESSYTLRSYVRHRGYTSSTGHYIACVMDDKRKKWIKFNDAISEETVFGSREEESEGYLFFYDTKVPATKK